MTLPHTNSIVNTLLLSANTEGPEMQQTVLMIVLAVLFFYFILFRPEQKRRKQMQAQRSSMQKGDRVTAMGIIGKIKDIKEKTIILENIDGSQMEILKAAITDIEPKGTKEKK